MKTWALCLVLALAFAVVSGRRERNGDRVLKQERRLKKAKEICNLDKVVGACNDTSVQPSERWFYNSATSQCEMFNFSGCGGNANNFKIELGCERLCERTLSRLAAEDDDDDDDDVEDDDNDDVEEDDDDDIETHRKHVKNPKKDRGSRKQKKDRKERREGKKDKKEKRKEMIARRKDKIRKTRKMKKVANEICDLPSETGPCRAHKPRWFFNSTTKSCEEFVYGGCRGNDNNFDSKSKCEELCLNDSE